MSHYRLRSVLPSSLATDLAVLLQTRMGEDEVRYAKCYMPGFVSIKNRWRAEKYQYVLSRLDDGGFLISETIGKSADTLRLHPPTDGKEWRSDTYPGWLTTAYNRLKRPELTFSKNEPPRHGPYLREQE